MGTKKLLKSFIMVCGDTFFFLLCEYLLGESC
uniref:Uncharacterized protein n=1 Tax=Myoviridae sp. ctCXW4 TaxID=2827669 RepID=A0A8S5TQ24_9CAUD|nr:MAG TPA: hypothetical protein [Myoviridae sp. ctCXW4]DAG10984.1 MAG TPA: hypothetical protein [Bacteriophage sp.]